MFPLESSKRQEALEQIAIFVTHNPSNYMRHFGFVDVVVVSLKSANAETQTICLYILNKLGQDEVLRKEIYHSGAFEIVKQILVSQDDLLRTCALAIYDQLCEEEKVKESLLKRVISS